jgi:hypothetical protein
LAHVALRRCSVAKTASSLTVLTCRSLIGHGVNVSVGMSGLMSVVSVAQAVKNVSKGRIKNRIGYASG